MNFLDKYAEVIVLFMLTSVAFCVVIAVHLHRWKHDRSKQHSVDDFFGKSAPSATNESGDEKAMVSALLKQAIASTDKAARAISDAQGRLEAISDRIKHLENQMADSATLNRAKDSVRSDKHG